MTASLYDIPVRRIDGKETTLADYVGSALLIVNVASLCGKTPQYDGLESMYRTYRDRGFAVLGFPSNQFDAQEPAADDEIAQFCRTVYGVDFPMFAKIEVKGAGQHPLYKLLTEAQPKRHLTASVVKQKPADGDVRWNFEKFLVDRRGTVVDRFDPDVTPEDGVLVAAVEKALAEPHG